MSLSDRAFSSGVTTPRDPLGLLEGRWILQILLRLKDNDLRFSDLRAALPAISANVLAQRMRDLEAAGLVRRLYLPPPAASQVYALAPSADSLRPALEYLAHWRARHRTPAHQEPV
ncbi:helix-turn-helix transcriptional regulator [Sphingomonas sp. MMSM20]|uniref:winged helix-turn-helix transcriptional regulator n=1 Tax=Sphingomonas lycopersici TaxID=2951807 RepID=UPI0022376BEA|nr:helix-turn-helix domain-containing protein [Sphingomonas lycopersici]MCW6530374.1 helix-turn-helix transcriptional regulator [Sphingomonas lycopersici]